MSRKMLAVAAFALMAPVAMAQAQLKFGVGLGASLPGGDIKDGLDMGYHAMVTAGIQPPLSPVGFRVDGAFNQFKEKSPGTDNLRIMSLSANAILGMPGAMVVKPYAIGGVGMYNSKNSGGGDGSNDLGVNLGAGVSFGLAGFNAFGEIRWHKMFLEEVLGVKPNVSYIPITFGITF
jgi:opacity protein-like surface antigen